jgi:hypothetical protein
MTCPAKNPATKPTITHESIPITSSNLFILKETRQ